MSDSGYVEREGRVSCRGWGGFDAAGVWPRVFPLPGNAGPLPPLGGPGRPDPPPRVVRVVMSFEHI